MRGKRDMKFCGPSFRSVTNVSPHSQSGVMEKKTRVCMRHFALLDSTLMVEILNEGSRYIYELYYQKQAISKQLYDWLLKNNYADANLIAKWKKQGYEKVRASLVFLKTGWLFSISTDTSRNLALLSTMHPDEGDEF